MDTKHTPGPWEMHQPEGCAGFYFDSGPVQFYVKRTSLSGADEMEANARLIAAAPALLAALENMVGCHGDDDAWWATEGAETCESYGIDAIELEKRVISAARKALAQAKGAA